MMNKQTNAYGLNTPDIHSPQTILPLSTAQRGQWIAQKLAPKGTAFNVAEYLEIQGELDVLLFQKAIQRLIKETDCIRSQIIETEDETYQAIHNSSEDFFSLLDMSHETNPINSALHWMKQDYLKPLTQKGDRLWFSALIKIESQQHIWYHRCHHVALDGFAGHLITQRLVHIYNSYFFNQEVSECTFHPLEVLLAQEQAYKDSKRFKADRQYWLNNLVHLPESVSLAQRIRPEDESPMRRQTLSLSAALTEHLNHIGQAFGASRPQTLIALVAAYFYRMTGTEDLVIAMPVSARVNAIQKNTPSMLANAVPIRLSFSSNMCFQELLEQTSKVVRNALRHQQYRYEDLKRDLGMLSANQQIASLGVNIEPFDYDVKFGHCTTKPHNLSNAMIDDLTVFIFDRKDDTGLSIEFDANPKRYTDKELTQHLKQLERLIKSLLSSIKQPISQASLLSDTEQHVILHEWNQTQTQLTDNSYLDMFHQQVERHESSSAVIGQDGNFTYQELNMKAEYWASQLINHGVKPTQLVAACLPRNSEMLAVLLGIWKAGAAYLPLDPEFPQDRLANILEDAEPACIVTNHQVSSCLPDTKLVMLYTEHTDSPRAPLSVTHNSEHTQLQTNPHAPAYVIYTSGSTGRPKGVEISHYALKNFLLAMQHELKFSQVDRFLAVTTISFDISLLELFLPIMVGGSVVIAAREIVRAPERLTQLANEHHITFMQATPSLWQALLPEYQTQWQGVRALVGGEALSGQLAKHMHALGHPVMNLYGPTETTIWSSIMPLEHDHDLKSPPIGRPIFNTQMYVLDKTMQPVPVGVTGDLYIAGEGLALGYYKRPDLTEERFINNPFAVGKKVYITGDKARWREDGVLEYLGRDDNQVKIRGFRIETGDIESALLAMPAIEQAVVTPQTSPSGSKQLVAYLLSKQNEMDIHEIRQQLITKLPDYMIPSHFITIDEMPLTPNGKINRKALPQPSWQSANHYQAPRNHTEKMLANLWAETLGLTLVGIHDNFFEIGGDSISATRILHKLEHNLGMEIPLGVLFKAATIAELAEHLQQTSNWNPLQPLLPIKSAGDHAPLFCIHPALGLSWGYAAILKHLPQSTPLFGLQSISLSQVENKPESLEAVASHYLKLIRSVQPKGPYQLLGWSFGGLVAHAITQQLEAEGESVDFLCMLDSYPYKKSYQEPKNEADILKSALIFLGYDLNKLDKLPINKAELAALLWRDYDNSSSMSVVKKIQDSQEDIMSRIQATLEHNLELASQYKAHTVEADILFFIATESVNGSMENILEHSVAAWQNRTHGKVESHKIPCRHQEMFDSSPLSQIAPIIRSHLNKVQAKQLQDKKDKQR
ncbi:amino acid adenylation domain-containing protein [Marinomonas sp. THO17]|uniref:amino acid adenylation domain-containing protein n=1 Tax=Marinomonas sp. THO17 TaxID=3149048 RepID=UPI00336BC1D4